MRTKLLVVAASVVASVSVTSAASAAPEWVDRRIVMSGNPVAGSVDVGMGVGHYQDPNSPYSATDFGTNFSAAIGIVSRVDVGVGFGVRTGGTLTYGYAGAPIVYPATAGLTQPDTYARFYEANAVGSFLRGASTVSNPELRVRGKIVDIGVFELGVEGRALFPAADGTRFATVAGVPMAVHAGHFFKLDFGVYNTFAFYDRFRFAFEVPVNVWFQATNRLFLGPLTGFRAYSNFGLDPGFDFALGFGLGVHLARFVDLKTQFVFPRINQGAEFFGAGIGVGFVFE